MQDVSNVIVHNLSVCVLHICVYIIGSIIFSTILIMFPAYHLLMVIITNICKNTTIQEIKKCHCSSMLICSYQWCIICCLYICDDME